MKVKKVPIRTCVVSREARPKEELIRIVRDKEKNISIDLIGKAPGRGAYLTLDREIILKAKKTKILDKKLEANIPDSIYEELLGLIK
ncbi:MAG TPA: YlxR family protein [Acholeplasmataceae bacterium]|jgi:predicted RNA-binding protein YlxR (DUF448 family)|nr:YlxR family protein [Acholeplasmataceae bacterium]